MKDIRIYHEGKNVTSEVKQRQRIPNELSLLMMRTFIFLKMLKQHLMHWQCSLADGSGHLSEVNINNISYHSSPDEYSVEQAGAVKSFYP